MKFGHGYGYGYGARVSAALSTNLGLASPVPIHFSWRATSRLSCVTFVEGHMQISASRFIGCWPGEAAARKGSANAFLR